MSRENIDTKKAPHTLRREYAVLWFYKLLHGVVAIGVVLLPVPAVGAHFLDAVLSHPAQLVLGLGGVGIALGEWSAFTSSPLQAFRLVQAAKGSLQKGSLAGSPKARKPDVHR